MLSNPIYQPLRPILSDADHVDLKTTISGVPLREFVAGFFSYNPVWIKALYRVRQGFVRTLGMRQTVIPRTERLQAADIPMQPGAHLAFFTVVDAADEHYWIAAADDAHLTAYLALLVEPINIQYRRFHVVTIVRYNNWAGPVYFNVIRPFHHLVVGSMMRAGARAHAGPQERQVVS